MSWFLSLFLIEWSFTTIVLHDLIKKENRAEKNFISFWQKWEIKEKEITFHVLSVQLVNTTSSYFIALFKETIFSPPEINLLFYTLLSFKHIKYMRILLYLVSISNSRNMWIIFDCYLTSFLNNQQIYLVLLAARFYAKGHIILNTKVTNSLSRCLIRGIILYNRHSQIIFTQNFTPYLLWRVEWLESDKCYEYFNVIVKFKYRLAYLSI